jgi:hypothetical protein
MDVRVLLRLKLTAAIFFSYAVICFKLKRIVSS